MGQMRDSDWSRQNLLRSDWLLLCGSSITTGEDVGDNTDFHVILSSLLKILKMKTHGSYKKVILDEKISITASESILCIPQQQSHFSHVLQVDKIER